jgi:hypothetical protein
VDSHLFHAFSSTTYVELHLSRMEGTKEPKAVNANSDGPSAASIPNTNGTSTEFNTSPDEDDESDVSMSADSDSEDEPEAPIQVSMNGNYALGFNAHLSKGRTGMIDVAEGSKKRKLETDAPDTPVTSESEIIGADATKRMKLEGLQGDGTSSADSCKDKSLLPCEIWHHIFTFTPPRTLGSLLQVNRKFNASLDPSSPFKSTVTPSLTTSVAKLHEPDAIWQLSRRLYRPAMPAPLVGMSELDMWKLACKTSCQFCNKVGDISDAVLVDQWHSGPGYDGVRPVWPFSVRTCGSCLDKNTIKVCALRALRIRY